MGESRSFTFGPFYFDGARDRLWREQKVVELRAKTLAVLRYLLERHGQVVTRNDLLKEVWPGIYVSKTTLRVCLREIRLALKDEVTSPQYIETIGRQGYRFIGQVVSSQYPVAHGQKIEGDRQPSGATVYWQLPPHFVGREKELAQLHRWLESALAGHQQLIFVTGEAGIGKTTLVNTFLHRAQEAGRLWIAHGQCVEQYGVGAPYLPLLGALGRLCQGPDAEQLVHAFAQHAPSWLAQLPTLLSQEQRKVLSLTTVGVTHAHMLRELGEVLARLSAERPLVLVLEDLHWSDAATVETLAYLARQRELGRLFILGTYRPADVVAGEHPLRRLIQELRAHELCKNLALELLSEQEVEEYVAQRLDRNPLVAELSPIIYQRTEGNALFVVNIIDYLLRQGLIQKVGSQKVTQKKVVEAVQTELPEGLKHLILKEVEGLSPEEQQVLEAASVAGLSFTAAEVAAADQSEEERIEAVCDGLVRQQRLIEERGSEEWPDGTITAGYQFLHAVYQQVVGSRVGQARQVRLHRLIGERLEAAHGARADEVASHLAVHFEQGRDINRAVYYRRLAAEQALRRNAYQEVCLHSMAGLTVLESLSDTPERKRLELELRQLVSTTLYITRGFTDAELEENLQRARQLCRELGDDTMLVSILIGLGRLYMLRANRAAVAELEQEEEHLAERVQDAQLLVQLHTQLATIATFRGLLARATEHYQHVLRHYDPQVASLVYSSFGGDPLVVASIWSSLGLTLAGQPDLGWRQIAQTLARAEELNQPLVLVTGLLCATVVKLLRGDYDEAAWLAQKMDILTREHEIVLYRTVGALQQGCIAVCRGAAAEGIATITSGVSQYRAMGVYQLMPLYLSFLAEGYQQQGKLNEALQVVNEALSLTATNFDVFWEAELYRIKGELLLAQEIKKQKPALSVVEGSNIKSQKSALPRPQPLAPSTQAGAEAEAYFLKAIDIARQQGAKLLELRAVMSLVRLRQRQALKHGAGSVEQGVSSKEQTRESTAQGVWSRAHATRNTQHEARTRLAEAHRRLSEIYSWFTEGFDTVDLQTARVLLTEWSTSP